MKKLVIQLAAMFLLTIQVVASNLPKEVLSTVLKHGPESSITSEESYEEDGFTFYEVTLEKKEVIVVLTVKQDGTLVDSYEYEQEDDSETPEE